MNIRLLYFASVRERLNCDGEDFSLPSDSGTPTLATLITALRVRSDVWAEVLSTDAPVKFAVNQQFAEDTSTPLSEGCEVAIFPPVTGG